MQPSKECYVLFLTVGVFETDEYELLIKVRFMWVTFSTEHIVLDKQIDQDN